MPLGTQKDADVKHSRERRQGPWHVMTSLQEIALGFMVLGGLLALLNWFSIYQTLRTGRRCSPIPLVSALFLGGGMLLHPAARPFAWLALVLDYGTLMLLLALPWIAHEV